MLCFMKNYSKMTLFGFLSLSLLLLASSVSAYSYNTYTDRDTFRYDEVVSGENRGFTVEFNQDRKPVSRGYTYCEGYGYYDWSYSGKKCAQSYGYGSRPYYPNQAYYNQYDYDATLKEAFKTYQQSTKQESQLEAKRIALEERRMYNYGGYGYGYYRYGW